MLDAPPCTSSSSCYVMSVDVVNNNTEGILNKNGNYWQRANGDYLLVNGGGTNLYSNIISVVENAEGLAINGLWYDTGHAIDFQYSAVTTCSNLGIGWRLPTVNEVGIADGIPHYISLSWTSTEIPAGAYHYIWQNLSVFSNFGYAYGNQLNFRCVK